MSVLDVVVGVGVVACMLGQYWAAKSMELDVNRQLGTSLNWFAQKWGAPDAHSIWKEHARLFPPSRKRILFAVAFGSMFALGIVEALLLVLSK